MFEQQDGQKGKRFGNNDITTTTTTTMKNNTNIGDNSSLCLPFLPDMNGSTCGYFFSHTNDSSYENNSINQL